MVSPSQRILDWKKWNPSPNWLEDEPFSTSCRKHKIFPKTCLCLLSNCLIDSSLTSSFVNNSHRKYSQPHCFAGLLRIRTSSYFRISKHFGNLFPVLEHKSMFRLNACERSTSIAFGFEFLPSKSFEDMGAYRSPSLLPPSPPPIPLLILLPFFKWCGTSHHSNGLCLLPFGWAFQRGGGKGIPSKTASDFYDPSQCCLFPEGGLWQCWGSSNLFSPDSKGDSFWTPCTIKWNLTPFRHFCKRLLQLSKIKGSMKLRSCSKTGQLCWSHIIRGIFPERTRKKNRQRLMLNFGGIPSSRLRPFLICNIALRETLISLLAPSSICLWIAKKRATSFRYRGRPSRLSQLIPRVSSSFDFSSLPPSLLFSFKFSQLISCSCSCSSSSQIASSLPSLQVVTWAYPNLLAFSSFDKVERTNLPLSRVSLSTSGQPIYFIDALTKAIVYYGITGVDLPKPPKESGSPFPHPTPPPFIYLWNQPQSNQGLLERQIAELKRERQFLVRALYVKAGTQEASEFEGYLLDDETVSGEGFTSSFDSFLEYQRLEAAKEAK